VMKNTVDERMADIYNSFNMAMKGGL